MVRINRTWQDCAKSCGISLNLADEPPVFLWDLESFNQNQMGTSKQVYLEELGEELGVTPQEARMLHDSILQGPYPGTLQLVEDLQQQRTLTGILSNTNETHWSRMMDPNLFPNVARLDVKVSSFAVELEKPDERIYRRFEELAGCAPADLVFFDDSEPNVLAAQKCGWVAHVIDPFGDPAAQMRAHLAAEGILA